MTARPLNYTTKIPARRTAGECLDLLAEAGALAVAVEYEDREPAGLIFTLNTPAAGRQHFTMPVDVAGMAAVLAKMLAAGPPHVSRAELNRMAGTGHARNVAWRVVRDWLAAQLAIIAAGMATLDQVMLPYMQVRGGGTLYELVAARGPAAIEAGGG
jgi:hypothetical protein